MSHDNFFKLSKSARNSNFIVVLPCFHLLHVHVHTNCLNLFTLVQFHTVTMPGEEVAEPPAKIPTLPFVPPSFNWNASNLYSQIKLFKTKVEFAFKGTYAKNPGHAKVGAILNWLGNAAFASLVPDGREVKVDPGRTNMKFHHVIKLMTVAGLHVNRILSRLCTIKVFVEISLTFVSMR